jgi:hypothetical protein
MNSNNDPAVSESSSTTKRPLKRFKPGRFNKEHKNEYRYSKKNNENNIRNAICNSNDYCCCSGDKNGHINNISCDDDENNKNHNINKNINRYIYKDTDKDINRDTNKNTNRDTDKDICKENGKDVNKQSNKIRTYRVRLSPQESMQFMQSLNPINPSPCNDECKDDLPDFLNLLGILSGIDKMGKKPNYSNERFETKQPSYKFEIDDKLNYDCLTEKYDSLEKLIRLGKAYTPEFKYKYAFDYEKLYNIVEPLEELQNVIGMESVKTSIVNQIMYFLLELEPVRDMLHTVIQGPPGVGKTMLGQILAKIYQKMGVIQGCDQHNPVKFKIYKRSDFVGQYLGHTAIKTQKAIDECLGGVMFIDEAYSLGSSSNAEKADIYSKECLDTIMQNLSEKAGQFVVIIAGYADELDKYFFAANEGLKRRFTFKYTIDKYDETELAKILRKKVIDSNWSFDTNVCNQENISKLINFIKSKYSDFPNFAGDIETLLFHIKVCHATRIFGSGPKSRKIITIEDVQNGFNRYKLCREETKKQLPASLYAMYN